MPRVGRRPPLAFPAGDEPLAFPVGRSSIAWGRRPPGRWSARWARSRRVPTQTPPDAPPLAARRRPWRHASSLRVAMGRPHLMLLGDGGGGPLYGRSAAGGKTADARVPTRRCRTAVASPRRAAVSAGRPPQRGRPCDPGSRPPPTSVDTAGWPARGFADGGSDGGGGGDGGSILPWRQPPPGGTAAQAPHPPPPRPTRDACGQRRPAPRRG